MNKCILMGRLTKDPDFKHTPSGSSVCNYSIATNEKYKDKSGEMKEVVDFHNIVVWGKQAESNGKYLSKGSQVLIEGKIKTRSYEDSTGQKKYVTDIVASSVEFINTKKSEAPKSDFDKEPPKNYTNEQVAQVAKTFDVEPKAVSFLDDDIPF